MLTFLPALWISQFGINQGWSSFNDNPRALGDINGDGKSDIIGFAHDGVYVSLSTGNSFAPATKWISYYGRYVGGWTNYDLFPRFVADVNGDGFADIVGSGYSNVYVSLSTGASFLDPSIWINEGFSITGNWRTFDLHPRFCLDINNDKIADIIGFGTHHNWYSYSRGDSFSPAQGESQVFGAGSGWTSFNYTPKCYGDINGDGWVDAIGFGYTGVQVSLSSGSVLLAPAHRLSWFGNSLEAGSWTSFDEFPRFVIDVNNDKKADIIGFGLAGVYVALSNGQGFDNPILIMNQFGKSPASGGWKSFDSHPRLVGDVTGDGIMDIVGFGADGVRVAVLLSDTSAWTSINMKVVTANTSACEIICFNECKDYEQGCLDKCKSISCENLRNLDTTKSEGKTLMVWAWILSFAALGVAILICLKGSRKSGKGLIPRFNTAFKTKYTKTNY